MLDECRLFTELWEPGSTNRDLEERVLEEGVLPNVTARRVRNLVAEMWSPDSPLRNLLLQKILNKCSTI